MFLLMTCLHLTHIFGFVNILFMVLFLSFLQLHTHITHSYTSHTIYTHTRFALLTLKATYRRDYCANNLLDYLFYVTLIIFNVI